MLFLRERRIVVDDVRGGREVLAMSYQRPLRRTGGTRGIDDEGGRLRVQSCGSLLEPPDIRFSSRGVQGTVAFELVVLVAEHRRVIDHHDPLQFTQFVDERQDLVDVFLIFRAAPSDCAARSQITHSSQLSPMMAIRSPCSTPRVAKARATRATSSA